MFIIFLKFTGDKTRAADHMAAHNAWLQHGFDDGAFLLSGSLQPASGGAILATGTDRQAVETRLAADPFVAEGIVTPELYEISPSKAAPQLAPLLT